MNAVDHATQAEIRLATLYVDYMAAERLIDTTGSDYLEVINAQWVRKDHYLDTLRELARELNMDLGLIFDVAKEIRAADDIVGVGP